MPSTSSTPGPLVELNLLSLSQLRKKAAQGDSEAAAELEARRMKEAPEDLGPNPLAG